MKEMFYFTDNDLLSFEAGQIMRGTLLLISYLLAFVASKKPDHDTKDHDPVTHEHELHDEDEEDSFDSGSGTSGSGEGKRENLLSDKILHHLRLPLSGSIQSFGYSLSLKLLKFEMDP